MDVYIQYYWIGKFHNKKMLLLVSSSLNFASKMGAFNLYFSDC